MKRKKRLICVLPILSFSLFLTINVLVQRLPKKNQVEDNWDNHYELQDQLELNIKTTTTPPDLAKKLMEDAETENSRRLEKIEAVCRDYGLGLYKNPRSPSKLKHPPTPQYSVFYFDRVHKWSLCPIYKAGSSTWLNNMLLLGGMTEVEIVESKKQLSEMARAIYPVLDPLAAEEELGSSKKVLTVRHPFERILSAYRDKLENINWGREHGTLHFYNAFGSKIVKKYRIGGNNTNSRSILQPGEYLWNPNHPEPTGFEPTFQEFVMFLIDSNLVALADDHWIPYYLFCTPCLLHYDFVNKIETFERDQNYVIRSLGLQQQIKPRWTHKTQFTKEGDSDTVSESAKIYFQQLTGSQISQLYEKYRVDFEMFDYDYRPYLNWSSDFT